ncbi:polymorphic toxin type 44 domain-containing protein [Zooshikella sp. RANM57]|uniref:polymorphic toxin type 44 domain-containing protein n=1 Tax=Zooshikella sp. RANM57 TaxID=3425863 RepID=UPI003D6F9B20
MSENEPLELTKIDVNYAIKIHLTAPKESYPDELKEKKPTTRKSPYSNHLLQGKVVVEYHLDFEGKKNSDIDRLTADGAFTFWNDSEITIPLTKEKYDTLKNVFIWGQEYAAASFRTNDVAVGRLSIPRSSMHEMTINDRGRNFLILEADAECLESVVDYIVREVAANRNDPVIQEIRDDLRKGNVGGAQYSWARKVHKDEGVILPTYELFFWGGGEWDHKPRIRNVWGATNRLGNSKDVYYYDMWSNFHYGFVGKIAGFDRDMLISGGQIAQFFDGADFDAVDDVLTQEGVDLQSFSRDDLLEVLSRNKKHFVYEFRKKIWENLDEQKKYVLSQYPKRRISIPSEVFEKNKGN